MLLKQKIFFEILEFIRHIKADHQPTAPDIRNTRSLTQLSHKITTHLLSVPYQNLFFHYLEHCKCCRASKMISAESCTQHKMLWLKIRRDHYSSNWKAIAHTFCH